ncbi:FmdB family zinc ribbon protein [Paraburkholderia sp.]|uniref:FmdB family zinc ribbon protein n=1 Tax=Paraburkholderia sp. TaxID=1926495 RepID=UPI0039E6C43D
MPIYEYQCADCGRFAALRRLADYAEPAPCPACGKPAPRTVSRPAWLGPSERQRRYDGDGALTSSPHAAARTDTGTVRQHASGCACCRSVSLTQAIAAGAGAGDDVD